MECAGTSEFIIRKLLAEGDYSKVYLCKKKDDKTKYAMKILDDCDEDEEEERVKSYESETKNLSKVNHENIIKWIKSEKNGDKFCIITEYFPGKTLFYIIDSIKRPLRRDEIFQIMIPLMSALCYLHNLNIMHGDVDVVNILIKFGPSKNIEALKLIDFGKSDPFLMPDIENTSELKNCCKIDVYQSGAVLLKMLYGTTSVDFIKKLVKHITRTTIWEDPLYQDFLLKNITPFFQELLINMLVWENENRVTSRDVLRLLKMDMLFHKFIKNMKKK